MRPQLPPPPPGSEPNLPAVQQVYGAPPSGWYGPGPDYDAEPPAVPLSHYLWILKRHRWKILSFIAACVAATVVVSSRITPIYESTAAIDIDRRMPAGIIGQEAMQYPTQDADQFLATQVKLIQSDSVLRPIVKRYKLDEPPPGAKDFFGRPVTKAPAALRSTAAEDAPVKLDNLKVTRPPNTYLLLISYRSANPQLAAAVANGIAQSYIEHTYNIRYRASAGLSTFMEKQLEELRAKMERSSGALVLFEKELNVINPEEKTNILSARLLQLNTEYTNAQTDRVNREAAYRSIMAGSIDAARVSTQGQALQRLQERLDEAQEKFAQAASHFGANHPEFRKASANVNELQRQLDAAIQAAQRSVEIEYRQALNRENMLKSAVAQTKAEADRLNARSFEYQTLKREAEADKKLYEELTTRIKEAGINAGFQNSAIRLADTARPGMHPVFPKTVLNAVLAFLFSTLLAVGAAILSDVLDNTVRDPEQVERTLGTEVVGSLPLVKEWRKSKLLLRRSPGKDQGQAAGAVGQGVGIAGALAAAEALAETPASGTLAAPAPRVPVAAPSSPAEFHEAISTLRNSILLRSLDRPLRSILVTSASPGEGKTTTALHLAIAHAEQWHRTLLIDADLRRPGIARRLGLPESTGLSTVLNNGMVWRDKLSKLEGLPALDILTAGPASRITVNLLGRGLPDILEEASQEYELVIVDSPPLHGFPEPLQMAASVDGVVVVSVAGQTNRKAVGSVIHTLNRVHANVVGLVLNEVSKGTADQYGYYGHYGYYGKYYRRYGPTEEG